MRALGFLLLAGTVAAPLHAQTAAPPRAPAPAPAPADSGDEELGADIVVTGQKPVGSVVGDIPPEQTLSPSDIRSYGVSSVADLLTELAPQTRSDRGSGGAPVVLVNGRRIASFSEIRDLPTEAILRVEILPEEVALKYGYRADQRVVNFVLRPRFRARTVELNDRVPTAGGRTQPEAELDWLRIQRTGRLSLHLEYTQAGALTEAERDIRQGSGGAAAGGNVSAADPLSVALGNTAGVPAAAATRAPTLADFAPGTNTTDQSAYRTLLPETHSFQANGVYATTIFGHASATFNARVQHDTSDADRGLAAGTLTLQPGNPFSPFDQPVSVTRAFDTIDPLGQRVASTDAHLGASFNGDAGRWRWSVTSGLDYSASDTRTDSGLDLTAVQARLDANDPTANPYGALDLTRSPDNIGRSRSTNASFDSLATGPLFAVPAGDVSTSLRIGASLSDFSSRSVRGGIAQSADIARDIGNAQLNLDVPIASRTRGVLSAIGDLSLNANVAADHLSDFGTLWTIGYGANWSPLKGVRVIASITDEDEAPSAQQLGNPLVTTPAVRVFDYVAGTTATVTTVSGGNRMLRADDQHVAKLGLDLKPWSARDISFTANYVTAHTDDAIASFPAATAAIEAAFPTRFTRVDGMLTRIDSRPINFARTERSELRYGVNLSFALKSKIQKELEAFRAGTGPNPFEGLRPPGGFRRPGGDNATPDGSATRPGGDGAGGPSPGGGDGGRPGGGFGGGRGGGFGRFGGGGPGGGGGRLQFALYHTWHFTDRVLIADGGPSLDLLNGDAIGGAGGQSRHELEGQAGYSNNGLGARASLNFQSATRVNGGTAADPQPLNFGSLTRLNLRLFADLGQRLELIKKHPWLRGTRVVLSVDNLFNQRQRVTDDTGTVPIGFQPGYLDPLGRTVRLSVRKLFF